MRLGKGGQRNYPLLLYDDDNDEASPTKIEEKELVRYLALLLVNTLEGTLKTAEGSEKKFSWCSAEGRQTQFYTHFFERGPFFQIQQEQRKGVAKQVPIGENSFEEEDEHERGEESSE
jgi:hypothetical protein